MISRDEILMKRDVEFPLTPQLEDNLATLLDRVNQFRTIYGIPMSVSSGYRPGHYNKDAGGAPNSSHKTCEAVDFHDADGQLKTWIANNITVLDTCDLYQEDPNSTKTWVHLSTRRPNSGNRVFKP